MTEQPQGRQSAYHSDYHTLADYLNFDDFKPALRDIIRHGQTPLTVGLFGAWGAGKTSLLHMLRGDIDAPGSPNVRTVWFTAWKYDRHDALWRAFILSVIDALYLARESRERVAYEDLGEDQQRQVDQLDRLQESVYRPVDWQEMGALTVDWLKLLREGGGTLAEVAGAFLPLPGLTKQVVELVTGAHSEDEVGLLDAVRREVHEYHRDQLIGMEQFERGFREALRTVLGDEGRLIVFNRDDVRCAVRNHVVPDGRYYYLGFRILSPGL